MSGLPEPPHTQGPFAEDGQGVEMVFLDMPAAPLDGEGHARLMPMPVEGDSTELYQA